MRADAQRNRTRILAAAEAVFAEHGPAASTEDVARRAGVAIGTVFRHFPTKEALIEAVLDARLRALTAEAASLAEADDPGAAFHGFLHRLAELAAAKHAYADALAGTGVDLRSSLLRDETGALAGLVKAVEVLLIRAQRAGAVRADVGVAELKALLVVTSRVAEYAGTDAGLRKRTLGLIADGLRP